jgi:hypothetical protein
MTPIFGTIAYAMLLKSRWSNKVCNVELINKAKLQLLEEYFIMLIWDVGMRHLQEGDDPLD